MVSHYQILVNLFFLFQFFFPHILLGWTHQCEQSERLNFGLVWLEECPSSLFPLILRDLH